MTLNSRVVLGLFTATQAAGALLLAVMTLQAHETRLTFNTTPMWALMVGAGAAAYVTWRHTEWLWAIAGGLVSFPMFMRAGDLMYNHQSFTGRVELRWALWLVLAVGTVVAWAVVGALAGLEGVSTDHDDQ